MSTAETITKVNFFRYSENNKKTGSIKKSLILQMLPITFISYNDICKPVYKHFHHLSDKSAGPYH